MNDFDGNKFVPVTISSKAIEEIRNIMEHKSIPGEYGLRIGVKGATGCSGVSYLIGFDKKKDSDDEYTIEGIPLYIEKKHTMFIIGLTVDFKDDVEARGFIFFNGDKKE